MIIENNTLGHAHASSDTNLQSYPTPQAEIENFSLQLQTHPTPASLNTLIPDTSSHIDPDHIATIFTLNEEQHHVYHLVTNHDSSIESVPQLKM